MALGNPRLVTWTANVIRVHELVGAGFVQIATIGADHDATLQGVGIFPELFFANDGTHVVARHSPTEAETRLRSFTLGLSQITNLQIPSAGVGGYIRQAHNELDGLFISCASDSNAIGNLNSALIDGAGALVTGSNRIGSIAATAPNCLVASPDGRYLFRGDDATKSVIWTASGVLIDGAPNYPSDDVQILSSLDDEIHVARWSADSRILYALSRDGTVYVLRRSNNQFLVVDEITEIGESPVQVAPGPDGRTVAISYDNGPRIVTRVYNRIGDSHVLVQTIASETFSFGGLLDFSGNGQYLIDAQNRRAYRKIEGVFEDATSIMSALPAGIVSQAVSSHVSTLSGSAQLYDGAVSNLATGSVNLNALKLMLLDGNAFYEANHASVLDVNSDGDFEVAGYGWPAGGKPLENPDLVHPATFSTGFAFDDVEQIIIEGDLVFRYGVIYDSLTLEPVVWIDFKEEVVGLRNRKLTFEMPTAGLITFSS